MTFTLWKQVYYIIKPLHNSSLVFVDHLHQKLVRHDIMKPLWIYVGDIGQLRQLRNTDFVSSVEYLTLQDIDFTNETGLLTFVLAHFSIAEFKNCTNIVLSRGSKNFLPLSDRTVLDLHHIIFADCTVKEIDEETVDYFESHDADISFDTFAFPGAEQKNFWD